MPPDGDSGSGSNGGGAGTGTTDVNATTTTTTKTMAEALSSSDPVEALLALSRASEARAVALAKQLTSSLTVNAAGGGDGDGEKDPSPDGVDGGKQRMSRRTSRQSSSGSVGAGRTASGRDLSSSSAKGAAAASGGNKKGNPYFPIPLPPSLRPPSQERSGGKVGQAPGTSSSISRYGRGGHHHQLLMGKHNKIDIKSNDINHTHPIFETPQASAESILSSLSKIATEGSKASAEMRRLEGVRRTVDAEADDIHAALRLRRHAAVMQDSCRGGRWVECARSVAAYREVRPSARALDMAGMEAVEAYTEIETGLQVELLGRYEMAVQHGDVGALSELTPLLGMLELAHKAVGMYLTYSSRELDRIVAEATGAAGPQQPQQQQQQPNQTQDGQPAPPPGGVPGTTPPRTQQQAEVPVTAKLAKIYNGGVTLLRYHLPMVASALGDADGDVELVKLVHTRIQSVAADLLRAYSAERSMDEAFERAETVSGNVVDRYAGGGGGGAGAEYQEDVLATAGSAIMAVTGGVMQTLDDKGKGGGGGGVSSVAAAGGAGTFDPERDDCGFSAAMGRLADLDAFMDETALCMQHTESYERFVRHAVEEVGRARELREAQREERRLQKLREAEEQAENDDEAGRGGDGDGDEDDFLLGAERKKKREEERARRQKQHEEERKAKAAAAREQLRLLTTHSSLDEVASEIGGHYSGIERCLLLASMQRAFAKSFHVSGPAADRNYSPVGPLSSRSPGGSAPGGASGGGGGGCGGSGPPAGSGALQTLLVEECLYAAQRSTLRAFATGHTGTACAMANYTADALGRALLEVLVRKTEMSTVALRPGEGLLVGQGGRLGQAALSALRGARKATAGAGVGVGGPGVAAGAGGLGMGGGMGGGDDAGEVRRRVRVGVARACASYNDVEIAVSYTSKLEDQLLGEIDSGFPPGSMTEQLRMCVRSLGPVGEGFREASDRAVEQLVTQILPRVRSIVNDAVGQESAASSAFGAMGGTVVGGINVGVGAVAGAGATSAVRMNYDLDEDAYELAEVGEGYMERLCSNLDELLEPLRVHLLPRLADALILGCLKGAAKRVEVAIKRTQFTALGALSLDSDVRYLLNFAKERFDAPELTSTAGLQAACTPLARLSQICLLMNVDELDDVLDLISSMKRKGHWDLKMEEAKTFLNLRVDFEGRKVNEMLRISEGEE